MTPQLLEPCPTLDTPRHPAGLGGLLALVDGAQRALPLKEVKVGCSIAGNCSCTVVEQRFSNDYAQPLEAVHIFPLPENGALVEMELIAGDITVRAECRERKEAEQVFAQARSDGHRAALVTQERDDVHTLRVTNLPPKTEVSVRMVIVERLEVVDGSFRWRFPTTIAPRFLTGNPQSHEGSGSLPDTDAVPDASRLQPPLRLEGGTPLQLEVEIEGPVTNLSCSLHAIQMSLAEGRLRVAPSGKASLNKDFILSFETGQAETTSLEAWTDGHHTLVQVNPPTRALPRALPRDAVFVVDISGSMRGKKMTAARDALSAALHGLSEGDRFKLIAFDDRLEFFADNKQAFSEYTEASLAEADRWIAGLHARGGTVMLPAIKAALEGETGEGSMRSVLFITDGQSWGENELVPAVAKRRKSARFFTLGIGTAVNAALLKTLARVGGGCCELTTPDAAIEETVVRLEARFGSPLTDGLVVEGHLAARPEPATVFLGRPAALLIEGAPEVVKVRGREAQGSLSLTAQPRKVSFPLGALWARERVAYLQDRLLLKPYEEEAIRPDIIEVALKHSIASRFTAFVAVEKSMTVRGKPVEVVQPAELPEEWDESFKTGGSVPPQAAAGLFQAMAGGMPAAMACPPPAPSAPSPVRYRRRRSAPDLDGAPSGQEKRKRSGRGKKSRSLFGRVVDSLGLGGAAAEEPPSPRRLMAGRGPGSGSRPGGPELPRPECPAPPPADAAPADPSARLARQQGADGSFGGSVERTAAAVLALVLLGHTRRKGARRRVLLKAAQWLQGKSDAAAVLALQALADAEAGKPAAPDEAWRALTGCGAEGAVLAGLL